MTAAAWLLPAELLQFLKKRHVHDIYSINTGKRNRGEYLWLYREVTYTTRI